MLMMVVMMWVMVVMRALTMIEPAATLPDESSGIRAPASHPRGAAAPDPPHAGNLNIELTYLNELH